MQSQWVEFEDGSDSTDSSDLLIDILPSATLEPQNSAANILGIDKTPDYQAPSIKDGFIRGKLGAISLIHVLIMFTQITVWLTTLPVVPEIPHTRTSYVVLASLGFVTSITLVSSVVTTVATFRAALPDSYPWKVFSLFTSGTLCVLILAISIYSLAQEFLALKCPFPLILIPVADSILSILAAVLADLTYNLAYNITFAKHISGLDDTIQASKDAPALAMHTEDFLYLLSQALKKNARTITSRLLSEVYSDNHNIGKILQVFPEDIDHACSPEAIAFICRKVHFSHLVWSPHNLARTVLENLDRFKLLKVLSKRSQLLDDVIRRICSIMFHDEL
jgi:hypothetical protein